MSRQLPVTPPRRGTKRPAPSRRESLEPLLSRTPNFGDSPPQRSAAPSTEVDPSELDAYLADVGKAFEGVIDVFATPRHSPSRRVQPPSPPSARTKVVAPFLLFEPPSPSPPRKPKTHVLSKMAWGRLHKRSEDCVNTFTRSPLARVASTSRIPTLPLSPRVQRGWNTTPSRKANLRAREEAEWLRRMGSMRQHTGRRHGSVSPKKSPAKNSAETKARIFGEAVPFKTVSRLGVPFQPRA